MKRSNSWANAKTSGQVELDFDDGLKTLVPLGFLYAVTETQSSGLKVTINDYNKSNSQLIYGDSGLRDITDLVGLEGASGGSAYIRRNNNQVEFSIYDRVLASSGSSGMIFTIPEGLQPDTSKLFSGALYPSLPGNRVLIYGSSMSAFGFGTTKVWSTFSWLTNQAWPNSFPGTLVGEINRG